MRFLVDANVLSEPTRPEPSPVVLGWLRENERDLAIDPIILGELRFGIHLLPAGRRRRELERWFDLGVAGLRCVPWDRETGLRWAALLAKLRSSGQAMPVKDSLIAATALRYELVVATRNVKDFRRAGARVLDPFAA